MTRQRLVAALVWPFWNAGERRLRALWRVVGFALVAAIITFALSQLLGRRTGGIDPTSAAAVVFALRALFTTTLAALVAVRVFGRRPARELGIVPVPGWWGDMGFGLFLGAALMTLIFGAQWLAGWVTVDSYAFVRTPGRSFGLVMLGMAVVALAVGWYEELLSRGYLLREMAQGMAGPPHVRINFALVMATLVSSAFFALGHANNPNATLVGTLNIFVAGVMLAVPFVLTGRLAASIGLHITWNFFQSAVYGLPTSGFAPPASILSVTQGGPEVWTGGAFGPEGGIVGLAAMFLGTGALVWRERARAGRVAVCEALVAGHAPPVTPATPAAPSALPAAPAS